MISSHTHFGWLFAPLSRQPDQPDQPDHRLGLLGITPSRNSDPVGQRRASVRHLRSSCGRSQVGASRCWPPVQARVGQRSRLGTAQPVGSRHATLAVHYSRQAAQLQVPRLIADMDPSSDSTRNRSRRARHATRRPAPFPRCPSGSCSVPWRTRAPGAGASGREGRSPRPLRGVARGARAGGRGGG